MACTTEETSVKLIALAYKYNQKKVLCFIMTKDAGSTVPGNRPYVAKYPDKHGNTCSRKVPRCEALSTYFESSNIIDVNNQNRQGILKLEHYWKTQNPWFRNDMTIIGMTAIDALKGIRYHCPHFRNLSVREFADRLAYDCINNPFNSDASNPRGFIPADAPPTAELQQGGHGPRGDMPSFVFGNAATAAINEVTNRMAELSCCGGINPSPLSFGGGSTFSFASTPTGGGDHDTRQQRHQISGRPAKRRCVVCGCDTRNECDNKACLETVYEYSNQVFRGVPVCAKKCGPRLNLARYGANNKLTCLEIHRNDFRSKQQGSH